MGEVGQWDKERRNPLFDEYRRAREGSAQQRHLLNRLTIANQGLIVDLVSQVRGDPPKPGKRFYGGMVVVGARELDFDETLNIGRFAFMKACEQYDPALSGMPGYLKKKIYYELQCLVQLAGVVKVDRGERPAGLEYLENDEHLGRLAREPGEEEDDDDQELELVEQLDDERAAATVAAAAPKPPTTPIDTRDARTALEVFLQEHCKFGPNGRAAATAVRGRYREVARMRGEPFNRDCLRAELARRGVRGGSMRAPWSRTPVKALVGVWLQNANGASS